MEGNEISSGRLSKLCVKIGGMHEMPNAFSVTTLRSITFLLYIVFFLAINRCYRVFTCIDK